MTKPPENVPKALDAIVDVVLAFKPKPKSKAGKKRKQLVRKLSLVAPKVNSDKKEHEY